MEFYEHDETIDESIKSKEEIKKVKKEDLSLDSVDFEESKDLNFERKFSQFNPNNSRDESIYLGQNSDRKMSLNKMDTLRINKINEILSQELDMQGVKIFDLHLLNMGK